MGSERPPAADRRGIVADPLERAAVVALLRTGRRTGPEYAQRVEAAGSALAVLRAEEATDDRQTTLLPTDPEPALRAAQAELDVWNAAGMRTVTVLDPDYPSNLREVHDRPPLLFLRGELTDGDARAIAVIGSRRASPPGLDAAARFAQALAKAGLVVLSGLAEGVDTAAHAAALAAGGRTMAVIGTGLDRCYPPGNARLQQQIGREGAVISQFWPGTPPSRHTFPQRNAVMSGLSRATVVVEASARSGARIQVRQALAQGRPVFLRRAVLAEEWGREAARRPGVHVVDDPEQIIERMERMDATDALVE